MVEEEVVEAIDADGEQAAVKTIEQQIKDELPPSSDDETKEKTEDTAEVMKDSEELKYKSN